MTDRLGDLAMQEVLQDHNNIIRRELASHGGFGVKSMGDGFMLAFSSARRITVCPVNPAIIRAPRTFTSA